MDGVELAQRIALLALNGPLHEQLDLRDGVPVEQLIERAVQDQGGVSEEFRNEFARASSGCSFSRVAAIRSAWATAS